MKRDRRKRIRIRQQVLNREQVSITGEIRYIIDRAMNNESRVVSLGSLVFFSTKTGDAWILDCEDKLALCLARDGEEQPFMVSETANDFKIGWNANYRIDGDVFVVVTNAGQVRTIIGYPTQEILKRM